MITLDSKYGNVKIFAKTFEEEAIGQVLQFANSPLGENAHVRMMPDMHVGKGCTIGTTSLISNKICPNNVGLDIGCGVDLWNIGIDLDSRLEELDTIIHKKIPSGFSINESYNKRAEELVKKLHCFDNLSKKAKDTAYRSLGTLGGGNHYIEAYAGGWISVHSGSRNLGVQIATYYQNLAKEEEEILVKKFNSIGLEGVNLSDREKWLKNNKYVRSPKNLEYLTGENMKNYLEDMDIAQQFASLNRETILKVIVKELKGVVTGKISSIHNYIDTKNKILRKGAIDASAGKLLAIPLNMRDGMLICVGKGNEDWNYSAPHGAGRLYSRSKAKEKFTVEEYQKSMQGIYTTCINRSTLDEAPFAYKDYKEIMSCIEPTVEIVDRLIPIYNFKAGE